MLSTGIGFIPGVILIIQGAGSVIEGVSGENPVMDVTVTALQTFGLNKRTGEQTYHAVEVVTGIITLKGLCNDAVKIAINGQQEVSVVSDYVKLLPVNGGITATWAIKTTTITSASISARIYVGGKSVFDYTDLLKTTIETTTTPVSSDPYNSDNPQIKFNPEFQ